MFGGDPGEIITTFNDDVRRYTGPDVIAQIDYATSTAPTSGWCEDINTVRVYTPPEDDDVLNNDDKQWIHDEIVEILARAKDGSFLPVLRSDTDAVQTAISEVPKRTSVRRGRRRHRHARADRARRPHDLPAHGSHVPHVHRSWSSDPNAEVDRYDRCIRRPSTTHR